MDVVRDVDSIKGGGLWCGKVVWLPVWPSGGWERAELWRLL